MRDILVNTSRPQGQEFQADLTENARATASVMAGMEVPLAFRPHLADLETGRHGIKWLIVRILRECGAVLDSNGQPEKIVTSAYVAHKVSQVIGPDRYTYQSVKQYLSSTLIKLGLVGKITFSNGADSRRSCKRPRNGYWLKEEKVAK